jgi:hypothetical protein
MALICRTSKMLPPARHIERPTPVLKALFVFFATIVDCNTAHYLSYLDFR